MGNLGFFSGLSSWVQPYGVQHFVETGTSGGAAVALAATLPFRSIASIDLSQAVVDQARTQFASDPRISIYQGDSAVVLPTVLQMLDGASLLCWLDAHYPQMYGMADQGTMLPLEQELLALFDYPGIATSGILIDDVWCYEFEGEQVPGNFPGETPHAKKSPSLLDDTAVLLRDSHVVLRSPAEQGYAAILPISWGVEAI